MKIIQFLSKDNEVLHGVKTGDGEKAKIIEGDIFEEFKPTNKTTKIKQLLPPVFPPNILAIGLNYRKHADETGKGYPDIPVLFIKSTNTLIGDGDLILIPRVAPAEVDFEAELGVVIGKTAKNVPKEKALDYVLGYTCTNDISARVWQKKLQSGQFARGKSFDTFCPIGPHLVTKDEIASPNNLQIQCMLNGKVMQDSNTKDMIFDVPSLISNLSQSFTLFPGTLILTGTPEGVGFTRKPQVFLRDGDKITVKIESVGELTNPVGKEG
jgi:2-keto-4-pentenoate hydratase/2-oxohepta-3-ene-1,7-dioic acid hydratase in catechol pathway